MLLFFFPFSISAQTIYTVQIGTYVNPKKVDFNLLAPLGYLYAERVEGNFHKVFLGEFPSEKDAGATLNAVKDRGFGGFIIQRTLAGKPPVIVIQVATSNRIESQIEWSKLNEVGKLFNRINIV